MATSVSILAALAMSVHQASAVLNPDSSAVTITALPQPSTAASLLTLRHMHPYGPQSIPNYRNRRPRNQSRHSLSSGIAHTSLTYMPNVARTLVQTQSTFTQTPFHRVTITLVSASAITCLTSTRSQFPIPTLPFSPCRQSFMMHLPIASSIRGYSTSISVPLTYVPS